MAWNLLGRPQSQPPGTGDLCRASEHCPTVDNASPDVVASTIPEAVMVQGRRGGLFACLPVYDHNEDAETIDKNALGLQPLSIDVNQHRDTSVRMIQFTDVNWSDLRSVFRIPNRAIAPTVQHHQPDH